MANPTVDISHGVTIAWTTSSWSSELVDVDLSGISRAWMDTSHQGTTDYRTYDHSGLTDPGVLNLTFHFDADNPPPIAGSSAIETITVTLPSAQTIVLSGGFQDMSISGPHGGVFTGTIAWKLTGTIDFNASS